MQEMNENEKPIGASSIYSGYAGEQVYNDKEWPVRGQKLNTEYETSQDALIRRIKQELQADSKKASERFAIQRFQLALVSICALVVLFSLVILALIFGHLSSGIIGLLEGTMLFLLGAIISINGYFNFAGMAGNRENAKKEEPQKKSE